MTIGSRIREYRKKLGLSVDDVAEQLGKNRATIYRYESDDIENLPAPVLEPLARVLRTTPAELMGWSDQDNIDFAKIGLYPLPPQLRVPIIGSVRCGSGGLAYEYIDGDYITIDADGHYRPDEVFALRCLGDSMIGDGIREGDICLVRRQPEVGEGQLAVVVVNGEEGMIKRVHHDKQKGVIALESSNPDYPVRIFTGPETNTVCIAGKVIEVRRRL